MREPVPRDESVPDRMIAPPRWRYRTTPERRHRAAVFTFVVVLVVGMAIMLGLWWIESAVDLSTFVRVQVWLIPTVAVLVWTIVAPSASESTDDNDTQTWPGYAIRYVLVGEDTVRPLPARLAAAALFGAPVGWALVIVGLLTLLGLTE